jgi:hypothetical protein
MVKASAPFWFVMAAIAVVGLACSTAPEPTGAIAPSSASQPPAPASPIAANPSALLPSGSASSLILPRSDADVRRLGINITGGLPPFDVGASDTFLFTVNGDLWEAFEGIDADGGGASFLVRLAWDVVAQNFMPVPGTMMKLDDPQLGSNHPYVLVKDGTVFAYWDRPLGGAGGRTMLRTSPVVGFPNFGPAVIAFERAGTLATRQSLNGCSDFAWFYAAAIDTTFYITKCFFDRRVVGLFANGWQPVFNEAWHPMPLPGDTLAPSSVLLNAEDYPWVRRQSVNAKFWEMEVTQVGGEFYVGVATGFADPPADKTALMVWKITELLPTRFQAYPIGRGGVLMIPTSAEVSIHGGALYEHNGQVLIAYDTVDPSLPKGASGPRYPTYKARIALVRGSPTPASPIAANAPTAPASPIATNPSALLPSGSASSLILPRSDADVRRLGINITGGLPPFDVGASDTFLFTVNGDLWEAFEGIDADGGGASFLVRLAWDVVAQNFMPVPGTMMKLDDPQLGSNHPYVLVKDGTVFAYWDRPLGGAGGRTMLRTSPVVGFPNFGPAVIAFERAGTLATRQSLNGCSDFAWFYAAAIDTTFYITKCFFDRRVVGLFANGWQPVFNEAWHPMPLPGDTLAPSSVLLNAEDYPWVQRQSVNAKFWEMEVTQVGGEFYVGIAGGFADPPADKTALMVWKITELLPTRFKAYPIGRGGVLMIPTSAEVSIHGGALYEHNGQVLIAYGTVDPSLPSGANGPRYQPYKARIALVGAPPAPAPPAPASAPTAAVAPVPVRQPASAASSAPVGTRVGERVPAFTVTTLDGVRLANADSQGKPYLLFFFATW